MSEIEEFKRISAEDFLNLDTSGVTLVDLREPDELIIDAYPHSSETRSCPT